MCWVKSSCVLLLLSRCVVVDVWSVFAGALLSCCLFSPLAAHCRSDCATADSVYLFPAPGQLTYCHCPAGSHWQCTMTVAVRHGTLYARLPTLTKYNAGAELLLRFHLRSRPYAEHSACVVCCVCVLVQ